MPPRCVVKTKVARATMKNRNQSRPKETDVAGISMDQTITKYCGTDWLDKLEQITGSSSTIDLDTYKKAVADIATCEKNIKTLFKRLIKQSFGQDIKTLSRISEAYNALSSEFMIAEKSVTRKLKNAFKTKKGARPTVLNDTNSTECVSDLYLPINIVKSDWYLCIKDIERTIYRIMDKIFVSPDGESKTEKTSTRRKNLYKDNTYENYQDIIKKHPTVQTLYAPFDIVMSNKAIFESILGIQRYSNIIINIIMTPMYNVKAKITKSYEKTLAPAFRSEISAGHVTKDLVISLLTDFIIAKYRASLTGSNKYMLQMLSSEITEGQLAGMDGARFADVMETIDLSVLDKSSKVASFAVKAKEIMRTLSTADEKFDASILSNVQELLGDEPEETIGGILAEIPAKVAEDLAKYDKILDAPEKLEEVSDSTP